MRKSFAVVGGVAAIALAAGCSSGSSGKSTSDNGMSGAGNSSNVVLAAFTKTTDGKTAKIVEKSELSTNTSKTPLATTSSGVIDLTKGNSQLVSDIFGSNQTMTIISAGDTIYEKMPAAMAKMLNVGTPWAKFSASTVYGGGRGSSSGSQQSLANPLQYLSSLQGVSGTITKVGTEAIDGAQTTHYRATVDLKKAAAKAGKSVAGLEKAVGTATLPVDIWVDGQGRLRREVTSLSRKLADVHNKPNTLTTKQTIDLSDYGTAASVTTPPANQTTDITKEMSS